jgi:MoaA/NifB/PqqE/SkfB family radical SAM enzyme
MANIWRQARLSGMKDIKTRIKENEEFSASTEPPFPVNMLIELTNACNHRCVFCANRKSTRKIGQIKETLLYRLLNEAHALGTKNVGLYSTGEPFLSKNLDKYVARAKEIGYEYVYFDTNGALATPERVQSVLEAGIDSIKFSINAGSSPTYKSIHGSDDFDKVISNLKFVSDFRKKHGKPSKIYVSYVVTSQNQNERELLKNIVSPLVDDIVFNELVNQGGMMVEENAQIVTVKTGKVRKPPCSMVFNRLHITCEGYLTACCVDFDNNLLVADLNKITLKEAWHSVLFKDLRKRHLEDTLQGTLCYNCLYDKNEAFSPLWIPGRDSNS